MDEFSETILNLVEIHWQKAWILFSLCLFYSPEILMKIAYSARRQKRECLSKHMGEPFFRKYFISFVCHNKAVTTIVNLDSVQSYIVIWRKADVRYRLLLLSCPVFFILTLSQRKNTYQLSYIHSIHYSVSIISWMAVFFEVKLYNWYDLSN